MGKRSPIVPVSTLAKLQKLHSYFYFDITVILNAGYILSHYEADQTIIAQKKAGVRPQQPETLAATQISQKKKRKMARGKKTCMDS